MPIDVSTACKLCSCGNGQHGPNCRRNYKPVKAIGNAEMVLAERSAKSLMSDGAVAINIGAVVTDRDSHVSRGFQNVAREYSRPVPEKADCTQHLTKTIGRNLMKADLKIQVKEGQNKFQAAYRKFGKKTNLLVCKY